MSEKEKKPKSLNSPIQFMGHQIKEAIFHPTKRIKYIYCPDCKMRLPANAGECPKCDTQVGHSAQVKEESPVPWWGAVLCIIIGISAWIASACWEVSGLDEAARALVYIPLGSLFGMSLKRD